jgi:hypothetical protein
MRFRRWYTVTISSGITPDASVESSHSLDDEIDPTTSCRGHSLLQRQPLSYRGCSGLDGQQQLASFDGTLANVDRPTRSRQG